MIGYLYKKVLVDKKPLSEKDRDSVLSYTKIKDRYKDNTFVETLVLSVNDDEACTNMWYIWDLSISLRRRQYGIKRIEKLLSGFLDNVPVDLQVMFFKNQTLRLLESIVKHREFDNCIKTLMKVII